MIRKFLVAPVLSAIAMFAFGAIFWMSPFPYRTFTPVGDNAAAGAALAQIFPATGTYLIPGPEIKDEKLLGELMARGPLAEVHFVREGHPMMEPAVLAQGFAHYFVVSLLLVCLMNGSAAVCPTYFSRVRFAATVGLVGAIFVGLASPIWWHHTWGYPLVNALYCVIEFTIAGLVLGKLLTPKDEAPEIHI
ncbi:MAG: hypothetical protein JSR48_08055 [Verrucomicrobia bacterium]|nr:hypothetical protein [Verrucomicrobiota bacterium]